MFGFVVLLLAMLLGATIGGVYCYRAYQDHFADFPIDAMDSNSDEDDNGGGLGAMWSDSEEDDGIPMVGMHTSTHPNDVKYRANGESHLHH